jgi:osmotically-inducible protein OsmY
MVGGCGDSPKSGAGVTPMDQSNTAPDRELTQRIRQALVADDSLSTTAKNVKVITTEGGPVTLRGPVANAQEKTLVFAKAREIAGSRKVVDELEVGVN